MVEFWREGHEGDEHEIIIALVPLEDSSKALRPTRVSALEHLGEIRPRWTSQGDRPDAARDGRQASDRRDPDERTSRALVSRDMDVW